MTSATDAPPAFVLAPAASSQKTCKPLFGVEPRQWPAFLKRIGAPHRKVGALTFARVADVLVALGEQGNDVTEPARDVQGVLDEMSRARAKRAR